MTSSGLGAPRTLGVDRTSMKGPAQLCRHGLKTTDDVSGPAAVGKFMSLREHWVMLVLTWGTAYVISAFTEVIRAVILSIRITGLFF